MGLAQLLERPRNWQAPMHNIQDTVSITENGQFLSLGSTTLAGNENNKGGTCPYNIVVERMWIKLRTNNLDALSVNTFTLRAAGADTAGIITITDASTADGTIIEITGLSIAIAAGVLISWRWNSDSVGSVILTGMGMSYRLVNPRA